MILIAGLGNPGEKYAKTRHNLGFMTIDKIADRLEVEFKKEKKFNVEIAVIDSYIDRKIFLIKPQTFMNNSGEAIKKIIDFYNIYEADVWVIHDDLDIEIGTLRIRKGGSSAGQKGVQSIIDQLGTEEFVRFRMGIKPENGTQAEAEKFVLSKFHANEIETVRDETNEVADIILRALKEGLIENTTK